jgi:hypothetical protein
MWLMYDHFKTAGFDKDKATNKIPCSWSDKGSIQQLIQRCDASETHTDRRRLNQTTLYTLYPEVAARTVIMRDRVEDQTKVLNQVSNWAINWHLFFVALTVVISSFIILFNFNKTPSGATLSASDIMLSFMSTLPALLILFIAVGQSFSFHTKYKASFSAFHNLQTLGIIMDAQILNFTGTLTTADLTDTDKKVLSQIIDAWALKLQEIQKAYADAYGGSFALIAAPT